MSHEHNLISIQLLDKIIQIRCPEEKAVELQKSARYLDQKMREISNSGRALSQERIVLMAAIHAIYELLEQQNQKDLYIDSLSSRIRELQKNNKVMPQNHELEV